MWKDLPLFSKQFNFTILFSVNLVPQGKAEQSTDYQNFSAKLAIIGPANNEWDDGCSATDKGQTYAWWGLQLPAVAHMTHFVIYYRKDSKFWSWHKSINLNISRRGPGLEPICNFLRSMLLNGNIRFELDPTLNHTRTCFKSK